MQHHAASGAQQGAALHRRAEDRVGGDRGVALRQRVGLVLVHRTGDGFGDELRDDLPVHDGAQDPAGTAGWSVGRLRLPLTSSRAPSTTIQRRRRTAPARSDT